MKKSTYKVTIERNGAGMKLFTATVEKDGESVSEHGDKLGPVLRRIAGRIFDKEMQP